jgi:hypothetical protein
VFSILWKVFYRSIPNFSGKNWDGIIKKVSKSDDFLIKSLPVLLAQSVRQASTIFNIDFLDY